MNEPGVQRGEYRYCLNGERVAVVECWSVSGSHSGPTRVESRRIVPGLEISVRAKMVGGAVSECEVEWHAEDLPLISATYRPVSGGVVCSRASGGKPEPDVVVSSSGGSPLILYPLMRIFTGPVMAQLLSGGGSGEVLVPYIADPDDSARLLLPEVTTRSVTSLAQESIPWAEGGAVSAHRWRFIGGGYDEQAVFWLDDDNRLLRYQWPKSTAESWEVTLSPI